LPLEWTAAILGLLLSAAALVLAGLGSLRLWRGVGSTGWLLPFGGLAVAAIAAYWDFATSGLECSLVLAWTGLSFYLLASRIDGSQARVAGVAAVLGMGSLARPDCVVESLAFVAVLTWLTAGWRQRALALAVWAAPTLLYQIFRMGYFASLVPNTALAKEA